MHAGISTANAMSAMTDVMNQAHVESGIRASDMPLVRKSSVVVMKFSDPKSCPTQKMAIDCRAEYGWGYVYVPTARNLSAILSHDGVQPASASNRWAKSIKNGVEAQLYWPSLTHDPTVDEPTGAAPVCTDP